MVLRNADLLEGVVGDNGEAILDDKEFSSLPPLLFEGVEEDSDEELEVDEGISSEEIVALLCEANQGVQGVDSEVVDDMTPLIPVEEEEESDDKEEIMKIAVCPIRAAQVTKGEIRCGSYQNLNSSQPQELARNHNMLIHPTVNHMFSIATTW